MTAPSWISPNHVTSTVLGLEGKLSYHEIIQQSAWGEHCSANVQISMSTWSSAIICMARVSKTKKKQISQLFLYMMYIIWKPVRGDKANNGL